jgi:hypothetical protein
MLSRLPALGAVAENDALTAVSFRPAQRFAYRVPAGPGRILRFTYAGAPKIRARTETVHMRVRGANSIRQDRRRVVNGEG